MPGAKKNANKSEKVRLYPDLEPEIKSYIRKARKPGPLSKLVAGTKNLFRRSPPDSGWKDVDDFSMAALESDLARKQEAEKSATTSATTDRVSASALSQDHQNKVDKHKTNKHEVGSAKPSSPRWTSTPAVTQGRSSGGDLTQDIALLSKRSGGKFEKKFIEIANNYKQENEKATKSKTPLKMSKQMGYLENMTGLLLAELAKPDLGIKKSFLASTTKQISNKRATLSTCLRIMEAMDPRKDQTTKNIYATFRKHINQDNTKPMPKKDEIKIREERGAILQHFSSSESPRKELSEIDTAQETRRPK